MEVKKLVCDVCGGQIEMQAGGKGACTSCGTPYSADIMKEKIQEIKGTVKIDGAVEIVNGNAEKDRLIKTAQECFRKGAVDEAGKMFGKISKDYPNEWKAWMGMVYCESLSLTDNDIRQRFIPQKENEIYKKYEDPEDFLDKEYHKALLFAPEEERSKINEYRQNFSKALHRRIEKIMIVAEINDIEQDIEFKKSTIQKHQKAVEENTKKYESEMNRRIFGGILIAIAIITCLSTYKVSFWGVIIGVAIGTVGVCVWNWTSNGDKFKKDLLSSNKYLDESKNELKRAEKELGELKNKLNKLN